MISPKNTQKTKKHRPALVISSDSDSVESVQYKDSSSDFSELDEEEVITSTYQWKSVNKVIGENVVFIYVGELFPGKIIEVKNNICSAKKWKAVEVAKYNRYPGLPMAGCHWTYC